MTAAASRAWIAARLGVPRAPQDPRAEVLGAIDGPITAEFEALLHAPVARAAVLVPLIEHRNGWTILLTERALHLPHHPGQISFPGGRMAPGETPEQAALREAWEEVGLPPADVDIAGRLPLHLTGTGFEVVPIVGFIANPVAWRPDPAEVAAAFELPLDVLLEPGRLRTARRERLGTVFRVHELDYDGRLVWGATAAMLRTFKEAVFG